MISWFAQYEIDASTRRTILMTTRGEIRQCCLHPVLAFPAGCVRVGKRFVPSSHKVWYMCGQTKCLRACLRAGGGDPPHHDFLQSRQFGVAKPQKPSHFSREILVEGSCGTIQNSNKEHWKAISFTPVPKKLVSVDPRPPLLPNDKCPHENFHSDTNVHQLMSAKNVCKFSNVSN